MIEVISGGLFTSIQDLGRFGYRKYGVPVSGAMDLYSAKLANRLLGNLATAPVLEVTLVGPVLKFTTPAQISITGASFSATLNNQEIPLNTRIMVPEHGVLKFGLSGYGARAYLAVSGGFIAEEVLGSFSQYHSITKAESIEKGDTLYFHKQALQHKVTASVKVDSSIITSEEIDVLKGPEYDLLSGSFKDSLFSLSIEVAAESNRMAYVLNGLEEIVGQGILTGPVQPGTVQLTPSGQCIVLMRDAQTTGGYARILQLSENAINRLGQKKAKEKVRFNLL